MDLERCHEGARLSDYRREDSRVRNGFVLCLACRGGRHRQGPSTLLDNSVGTYEFSGTLDSTDAGKVFLDVKPVQPVGTESGRTTIVYDLGIFQKDHSGDSCQPLVVGRSVADLVGSMDDKPEPYSSPADIAGTAWLRVDRVTFSCA